MRSWNPWFRIGRLEVTTTILVLFALAASVIVYAVEPVNKPVMSSLALLTSEVSGGEVWRLVTWPFATLDFTLWVLVSAYVFLFSGSDLEREAGRTPFVVLLVGSVLALGAATYGAAHLFDIQRGLVGFGTLATVMLLLYCAEHPDRPFFLVIRAWMVGIAIVALTLINDIAVRRWDDLVGFVLGAVVIAIIARSVGLLTMYSFIPSVRMPKRSGRRSSRPRKAVWGKEWSDSGRSSTKTAKKPKKGRRPSHLTAVPDPPREDPPPFTPTRADQAPDPSTGPSEADDEMAMDALLDKISEGGLASLTDAERAELEALRVRLRERH